jgi:hypothetical protein
MCSGVYYRMEQHSKSAVRCNKKFWPLVIMVRLTFFNVNRVLVNVTRSTPFAEFKANIR